MKKQKAMKSDLLAFLQAMLPKNLTVSDAFMENSWIVAILSNGLRIKIKQ